MRVVLFTIMILASAATSAQDLFKFSNAPEIHGVGIRYVKQYDRTRSFTPQRSIGTSVRQGGKSRQACSNGHLVSGKKRAVNPSSTTTICN